MWLITPLGFFSVVRKPTDVEAKTLTVRARVRSDLEALKANYLPQLGAIQESRVNDYRFRAVAPQAAGQHRVKAQAVLTPVLAQAHALLVAQGAELVVIGGSERRLPVPHKVDGSHASHCPGGGGRAQSPL